MADYRDTLILPFEKGLLAFPQMGENWCVLNADILPQTEPDLRALVQCEQGFRPPFLALETAGYSVQTQRVLDQALDGCLVLASRTRAVNEDNLIRAWNALKPGGLLLFAGDKTSGVQPLRKWLARKVSAVESLSKHHAVAFWAIRNEGDAALQPRPAAPDEGPYRVAPGMFSADGPDAGSQLLAQQFDQRIFGRVADFGAGWGYLSNELLKRCDRIERLELYEADWASLQAAQVNVGDRADFHWCDLTAEAPRGPFNWIIMNPPFHSGRAATPGLGTAFIQAAARALPGGGRLLMVANTNLPYEKTLTGLFKKVERRAQAQGFKIIEAVKGSR